MTTFTKTQYEEIVRVLEKEKEFFQRYGAKRSDRNNTYGKRRSIIGQFLSTWRGAGGYEQPLMSWPSWVGRNDIEDRDQIRRYFDDLWNIDQVEPNKYASLSSVWDEAPTMPKKPKIDVPKYAGFLYDGAVVLENDGAFYSTYKNCSGLGGDHRRMTIERFLKKLCGYFIQAIPDMADYTERLRLYFDDTILSAYPCKSGTLPPREAIEFWRDEVRHPEDCARHKAKHPLPIHVPGCPIPIPSPEYLAEWQASQPQPQPESTMSKPITITTKTFANGTDISTMADAEVFNLIAEQEAEIEALKKIKAQPKKLVDEIAKREAGIAALVAYLDSVKS